MKFAICNETWGQDADWAHVCGQIARAGYDGVEIAPFTLAEDATTLSADRRREVRRIATDNGLAIVGLHWLLVAPTGLHLTTADAKTRQRTSDFLRGLAALCYDLGGTILVLGSPKQRSLEAGTTRAEAEARYLEALRPCLSVCEQAGVTLCIEPLGPIETDFINTLAEAEALMAQSGSPACRTIFDVKAASTETTPLTELIRTHQSSLAHVHVNDVNRRGPGFGETDFVPILATLNEIHYADWVSVEVFDYTPDPDTIALKSLQTLKEANRP